MCACVICSLFRLEVAPSLFRRKHAQSRLSRTAFVCGVAKPDSPPPPNFRHGDFAHADASHVGDHRHVKTGRCGVVARLGYQPVRLGVGTPSRSGEHSSACAAPDVPCVRTAVHGRIAPARWRTSVRLRFTITILLGQQPLPGAGYRQGKCRRSCATGKLIRQRQGSASKGRGKGGDELL